ncbi:MAG: 4-hydroxy-3-methylbut-2-enyl diphosphate reductase [Rickettsiales bacterium]
MKPLTVVLAKPRGFCAGVERAVTTVENALAAYGPPVYVKHEIVHNRYVIDDLTSKGVIFVDELDAVPEGAITIFSAHGVSDAVEKQAAARGLRVIDATCPLVTKVHNEAIRHEKEGREIVLIGHAGHPEVEGTSGRVNKVYLVESEEDVRALRPERPDALSYVTQTTLSVDDTSDIVAALKERFPTIKGQGLNDICYATRNRQQAVKQLATMADVIFVIGAANSSNSNRLRDIGQECGVESYLINDRRDIDMAWLCNKKTLGVTAGASAPESLAEELLAFLAERFALSVIPLPDGKEENVSFRLPAIDGNL